MITVAFAVGSLPPLLCHVDLGARHRLIAGLARKASKAEEVTGHAACRVIIGQEWGELGSSVPHLINFGIAQFADHNRFSTSQLGECVQRKPAWLLESEVAPGRRYYDEA